MRKRDSDTIDGQSEILEFIPLYRLEDDNEYFYRQTISSINKDMLVHS